MIEVAIQQHARGKDMLEMVDIEYIRKKYIIEGWSIRKISRNLNVAHNFSASPSARIMIDHSFVLPVLQVALLVWPLPQQILKFIVILPIKVFKWCMI